ncbi:MAG TPA: bifunctional adenosylcobinamide kinase/adenosylcobinamide-phosphate guanylyltransferase [Gaiellaceae bacterium]|nr:bifunctional adenosylcobinamide kinase/adenosylcobinamide-phosphate guanylyltransferase [Gaiellaceae bacterium]
MTLVVLLGGARSGKSTLAVALAREQGGAVMFLATGEAGDEEMARRIESHRRERPPGWETLEAPIEVAGALASVSSTATVVLDCLSLWVANLQQQGLDESEILAAGSRAAAIAAERPGLTVTVSNEVGLGIVPPTPLGRAYRDLLGAVNKLWVDAADEAWLVVAGRRLRLD